MIGKTTSKTMMNRSGKLYIFEKDGKRIVYDVLSSFARCIECDISNLRKTLTNGKRVKEWRLTEVIDLIHPDWAHIDIVLKDVKITSRIEKKLTKIREGLIDLKHYGIPKDDDYVVRENHTCVISKSSGESVGVKPKDDDYVVRENHYNTYVKEKVSEVLTIPKDDDYVIRENIHYDTSDPTSFGNSEATW